VSWFRRENSSLQSHGEIFLCSPWILSLCFCPGTRGDVNREMDKWTNTGTTYTLVEMLRKSLKNFYSGIFKLLELPDTF